MILSRDVAWGMVESAGSIKAAARQFGIAESKIRRVIGTMNSGRGSDGQSILSSMTHVKHLGRIDLRVENGTVVVFSDPHYYPGVVTTAHRALLSAIKQLNPVAVICNGDAFDGAQMSRYPSIGWQERPSVKDELEAVTERLGEIEALAKGKRLIWNLGNHDARYETRIANVLPELRGVEGVHLKDFFPLWSPAWVTWINGETCVTHFYHTGMHAVWNNLLKAQTHYVSSHRHQPEVRAYTNAKGETIYGVDTGTLADALGQHNLDYQQGRHGNHRSGFAVLTYRDGQLLMPELVQVWDEDTVQFRGHLLNADSLEVL